MWSIFSAMQVDVSPIVRFLSFQPNKNVKFLSRIKHFTRIHVILSKFAYI